MFCALQGIQQSSRRLITNNNFSEQGDLLFLFDRICSIDYHKNIKNFADLLKKGDFMPTLKSEFVDRIEPQKTFWEKYNDLDSGSATIVFYGEGGIGKTRLLGELSKEFAPEIQNLAQDVAYAHYDFENIFDTRTILLSIKYQLDKQGFTFPLFEIGNFYYSLKIENLNADDLPKIKKFVDKSQVLRGITTGIDFVMLGASMGMSTTFAVISAISKKIFEWLITKKLKAEILRRFELAIEDAAPNKIYKLLPELFALDIKNYFENANHHKKALVVFFDTYEKLVNEAKMIYEERVRDLWLRGEGNGIMSIVPNTLWIIAGRTNLQWSSAHANIPVQSIKLAALSENDSKALLEKSGVENSNLRDGIAKLTQGSPIFLTLCLDIYHAYKDSHNGDEPDISKFDAGREKVVRRVLKYTDAQTQETIKFLCALNIYTDDIACEIGDKTIVFNDTIYEQTKNFSFLHSEEIIIDDFTATVYSFDKTVQADLFPSCSERLIKKIKKFANEYFNEALQKLPNTGGEFIFNLMYWTKLLARYIEPNDADFIKQYSENISAYVSELMDSAKFDDIQNIIDAYFEKVINCNETDTMPYALFELETARLKFAQGFYQEAADYSKSAYEKFLALTDEEEPQTLDAMAHLARSLNALGKYQEALELQKNLLELYRDIFGDKNSKTVGAMHNLAVSLNNLELHERYEEALKLLEKVLKFYRKTRGDKHPDTILATRNLISTLNNLGRYEKSLELQKQVLDYYAETFGGKHPKTIDAMNNLAAILFNLERHAEEIELRQKVFELYSEVLGADHPKTIHAMGSLAMSFSSSGNFNESIKLVRQILKISGEIAANDEILGNTMAVAYCLNHFIKNATLRAEALELVRQALNTLKKFDYHKNPITTITSVNLQFLSYTLTDLGYNEEASECERYALNLPELEFDFENDPFFNELDDLFNQWLADNGIDLTKNNPVETK